MTTYGSPQDKRTVVARVAVTQFTAMTEAGSYATTGLLAFGICEDKPNAGDHVGVIVAGGAKILVSSGGAAVGDNVTVTTSGWGTKVKSGDVAIGRCLTAAASGGIAEIYKFSGGITIIG